MLRVLARAALLTAILAVTSLVFAAQLIVSALILATVGLTAVALVIGPDGARERGGDGSPSEAEGPASPVVR